MILHIRFTDGSNPYFFRSDDKKAILKEFKRWQRGGFFPRDTFTIYTKRGRIVHDFKGVWYFFNAENQTRAKTYKRLGNALNATRGGACIV